MQKYPSSDDDEEGNDVWGRHRPGTHPSRSRRCSDQSNTPTPIGSGIVR